LSLNTLDWIIVAVVVLGGWNGYRQGLFKQITRLFGVVIAYFLSMLLKPYVAPFVRGLHLIPPQKGIVGTMLGDFSDAISFGLVFVVTFILLRYVVGLVDTLFSLPLLSGVNRLLGLVVGLVFAIVFVYVATLILRYVQDPPLQKQLNHSSIVRYLDGKRTSWNQWATSNTGK
jgi:uncharacterized membrane protein required for colicin V production